MKKMSGIRTENCFVFNLSCSRTSYNSAFMICALTLEVIGAAARREPQWRSRWGVQLTERLGIGGQLRQSAPLRVFKEADFNWVHGVTEKARI